MSTEAPSHPTAGRSASSSGSDELWVLRAPCGCRTGWLVHEYSGREIIPDEAAAWEHSPYGEVRTARMRAEGWRWALEVMARDETSAAAMGHCPHTPEYHSPASAVPAGYVWAAQSKTSTVDHLIPDCDVHVLEDSAPSYANSNVAPLCSNEVGETWWIAANADPCTDCESAAASLLDVTSDARGRT